MSHVIKISLVTVLTEEQVRADPNPSPAAEDSLGPGDTVAWLFDPQTVGGRDLQVAFRQVADFAADGTIIDSSRQPCNPMGPLSSISLQVGGIVGTLRMDVPQTASKRFFYQVFENGIPFNWVEENGLTKQPQLQSLGGGLDIPKTPPPTGLTGS